MQTFPNIYTLVFYICEKYNFIGERDRELLNVAEKALLKVGAIFPNFVLFPGKEGFTLSALGYEVENDKVKSKEIGDLLPFADLVIRKGKERVGTLTFFTDKGKRNCYTSYIFLSANEVGEEVEKRVIITDIKSKFELLKELAFPFAGD